MIQRYARPKTVFEKMYEDVVSGYMMQKYRYKNPHQIPRIRSVVISSVLNTNRYSQDMLYKLYNAIYLFSGTVPKYIYARRSIAQFKTYRGNVVGCKVDLHSQNMFYFLERFVNIYLPNVKGFEGLKTSSITENAINIGISDISIAPEVMSYLNYIIMGATITIHIDNARNKEEIIDLLRQFYFPFKNLK